MLSLPPTGLILLEEPPALDRIGGWQEGVAETTLRAKSLLMVAFPHFMSSCGCLVPSCFHIDTTSHPSILVPRCPSCDRYWTLHVIISPETDLVLVLFFFCLLDDGCPGPCPDIFRSLDGSFWEMALGLDKRSKGLSCFPWLSGAGVSLFPSF